MKFIKLSRPDNKIRNRYKAISIFGSPSSGKTIQAIFLGDKNFYLISIGEFLKKLEKDNNFQKSALGRQVAKLMALGQLINNNIAIKLLFDEIEKNEEKVILTRKNKRLFWMELREMFRRLI